MSCSSRSSRSKRSSRSGSPLNRSERLERFERLERGASPLHLTSPRRIGERFVRDADEFILTADHFAQINILDRIVRFRHRPGAARAVDLGLLHGGDHFFALADIAFRLRRDPAASSNRRRSPARRRRRARTCRLYNRRCGSRGRVWCLIHRRSAAWFRVPRAASSAASSTPSVRKPEPNSGMVFLSPAAA